MTKLIIALTAVTVFALPAIDFGARIMNDVAATVANLPL